MLSDCKSDRTLPEAPRAYSGSAPCLFWKRLALISEAPCGYFGSAGRSEALSVLFHAKVSSITMYLAKKTELFWGNQS